MRIDVEKLEILLKSPRKPSKKCLNECEINFNFNNSYIYKKKKRTEREYFNIYFREYACKGRFVRST